MAARWTSGYLESADATYSIPVSSVAGLSPVVVSQSRTLRELLSALGKSGLQSFTLSELEYDGALGEGISYKVTRHVGRRDGKIYAVKEIKLPVGLQPLQRHIACVLRDVEVMSRLATHTNIMGIYGWGWNSQRGGSIPFLVTEYAEYGTLRQFLSSKENSVYDKLVLCRDVAQALQALHETSIAHGDLKLDNILVTPAEPNPERSCKVSARVSDFGHALTIPIPGGELKSNRTYGGTLAYNPPEVLRPTTVDEGQHDFKKCDIWSFGLLCWEALDDGRYYHKNKKVQTTSLGHQRTSFDSSSLGKSSVPTGSSRAESSSSLSATVVPSQTTGTIMKQDIYLVAPYLADIACEELREAFGRQLTQGELDKLCIIIQSCLQVEVKRRAGEVTDLPLLLKHHRPEPAEYFLGEAEKSPIDAWSFDIFKSTHSMPQEAKAQLLKENITAAMGWGRSNSSARAAFQAALACIERFGTPENLPEARRYLSVNASKGFPLGNDILVCLQALFESISPDPFGGEPRSIPNWDFSRFVRMGFRKKATNALPVEILSQIPMMGQLLSKTMMKKSSSTVLSSNGETLLQLAFKLGRESLAKWLLEQQNSPWSFDQAGCGPLHWLFMFTEEEMKQITEALMHSEDAESHMQRHLNALSTTEELLDPQLPVCIFGTPLAFATASGSRSMITYLLGLGADPLLGRNYPRQTEPTQALLLTGSRLENSALHIACRYHNFKALKLYILQALAKEPPKERDNLQKVLLQFCTGAYSSATRTERLMYHGYNARKAAKDTASFLLMLCEESEPNGLYIYRFLHPAILRGDLDTAYGILNAVQDSGSMRCRSYLKPQECRMLIFHCTQEACTGNHHPEMARQMLDFAIKAGSDINCIEFGLKTQRPINLAIRHRNKSVFDWFVSHGANLNVPDQHGVLPIHHMISNSFFGIYNVAEIVRLGVSTRLQNDQGLNSLGFAIEKGQANVLRDLIRCERESGLDPCYRNLLIAATKNLITTEISQPRKKNGPNADIITVILDEADKVHEVLTESMRYALSQASLYGWTDVVRVLLEHGCPLLPEVGSIRPPLFVAAIHGHIEVVRALLDAGADPNYRPISARNDWLTLMLERDIRGLSRVYKCAEFLVEKGADVEFYHLELAVQKPRPPNWQDLARLLLDKGVDPTRERGTWISDALKLKRYDLDLVTFIVRSGALVPTMSEHSNETLQLLARRPPPGYQDCAEILQPLQSLIKIVLNMERKIFRIDENGNTPLQNALEYGNMPVFSFLLREHHRFGHVNLQSTISNTPLSILLLQKRIRENQGRKRDEILNWALLRSCWLQCVDLERWTYVGEFLKLGIVGPTQKIPLRMAEVFGEERARRFLRWALNPRYYLKSEVAEILALFFGTSDMCPPHIRLPRKDDYLAEIVGQLSLDGEEAERVAVFQEMNGYAPKRIRDLYFEEGRARGSEPDRNMVIFVAIDYGRNPPPPNQMSILFEDEVAKDATLENLQLLGSFRADRNGSRQPPTQSYHVNWVPGSISGDNDDSSRYRAITSFFYSLPSWKRNLMFRIWQRWDGSPNYIVHNWRHDCETAEGQRLIRGVGVPPQ